MPLSSVQRVSKQRSEYRNFILHTHTQMCESPPWRKACRSAHPKAVQWLHILRTHLRSTHTHVLILVYCEFLLCTANINMRTHACVYVYVCMSFYFVYASISKRYANSCFAFARGPHCAYILKRASGN